MTLYSQHKLINLIMLGSVSVSAHSIVTLLLAWRDYQNGTLHAHVHRYTYMHIHTHAHAHTHTQTHAHKTHTHTQSVTIQCLSPW